MLCPKCNKESSSDKECSYCGIIFEKYQQRQKMIEKNVPAAEEQPTKTSRGALWGSIAAGMISAFLVVYVFFAHSGSSSPKNATVGALQSSSGAQNTDTAGKTPGSDESIINEASLRPMKRVKT